MHSLSTQTQLATFTQRKQKGGSYVNRRREMMFQRAAVRGSLGLRRSSATGGSANPSSSAASASFSVPPAVFPDPSSIV